MYPRPKPAPDVLDGGDHEQRDGRGSAEYRAAFGKYLCTGQRNLTDAEQRALSAENDPQGGYLLAPQQTGEAVLTAALNSFVIGQLATRVELTAAQSVGVPTLDVDPDDPVWTSEVGTGDEDSAMRFGKRELLPRPLAKRLKASAKLLSRAKNAEPLIRDRLAYKLGVAMEKAFMTGAGSNGPLGLFTASTMGISTGRDVSSGNTSTTIGGDGLVNAMYSLKEGYLRSPSPRWIFHRDAVKMVRLLKDTAGLYVFDPADQLGQPDLILGVPVALSEYAPNTFTTGKYVGLIGDLSYYWIADTGAVGIQRLGELYIESSLIGFIARAEVDGTPAMEEAFARVTLA